MLLAIDHVPDVTQVGLVIIGTLTTVGLGVGFLVKRLDRHNDQVSDKIDRIQKASDEAKTAALTNSLVTESIKNRLGDELGDNHGGIRQALNEHIQAESDHNAIVNQKIDAFGKQFDQHLKDSIKTRQAIETAINEIHARTRHINPPDPTEQPETPPKPTSRRRAPRKPKAEE